MRRRLYMSALALLTIAALSACATGSVAPDTKTTKPSVQPQAMSIAIQDVFSHLPIYAAEQEGFLKKHGISTVNFVTVTSLPAMTAAVSQGQVDAGFQTPILLAGYNAGTSASKLKFFADGAEPTWDVVARKGANIPTTASGSWKATVRSWKGKRIGVPAIGGSVDFYFRYLIQAAGLKASDVDIIGVGPTAALAAALAADQIDLTAGDSIIAPTVINSGVAVSVLDSSRGEGPKLFKNVFVSSYFASQKQIQDNPALYRGFSLAIDEAHAWLLNPKNKSAVTKLIEKRVGVAPDIARSLASNMSQFDTNLGAQMFDRTIQMYKAIGALSTSPSYSEMVAKIPKGK